MPFPFPPRRVAVAAVAAGAVVLAAVLSACSTTTGHAQARGAAAAQAATTSDSLAETTWDLVTWTNADGGAMAVPGGNGNPPVGLAFLTQNHDYRVAGFSGCNRYMGAYRLQGGKLSITVPAASRMGCPSDQLAGFETAYLKALGHISTFTLDSGGAPRKMTLNLQDGGVMTFKRGEDVPTKL
ncbi:hypothetical protein CAL29_02245 [Bordetella genomosp. 10]|uniref:DUF306 domain-containing protein n=1 Tax=Bordetella genomosp. 10 TaxID=1416804 RepID=A0A261SIK4_9BORD|nr:META domain-containing protein [Bordetella genomosp. 10]OZI37269.1 hypothetical protein CAL29_02245 [Bordetella genomosp. 10]